MNKVPIAEIFSSITGEGKSLGTPSIFIRFYGCNLRCRFLGNSCDTPYAVITEKEKALMLTEDELEKRILTYKPTHHIVFTGGETTIYQDMINAVMNYLRPLGYTAEIETNGTIPILPLTKAMIDQFNVSVKLKSSNQAEGYDTKRINHLALKSFPPEKSNFKFVVTSIDDISEILRLHELYPKLPVYLMPQGMTRDEIIANGLYVVELCMKYNFFYSPREQIIIWGKKRGV
jgi:organic radical activating enzyme